MLLCAREGVSIARSTFSLFLLVKNLSNIWAQSQYQYKGKDLKDVRYSKAQKMLKFTFNALIQQLLLQSSYYVSYSYSEAYKIGSNHTI